MNHRQFDPTHYHRDVLAQPKRAKVIPEIPATKDVVAEDPATGFTGAVVECTSTTVTLADARGNTRTFPLAVGVFLIDGQQVTLVRPKSAPAGPKMSVSGSVHVAGLRARTARAARIWVEGIHDAALVERVWGHDLRVEGVVVEPIDGLDNLPAALAEFGPGPQRRVGVLADHLVPGSKETRIAQAALAGPGGKHILVTGHPYIDIWEAVRPAAVGIPAWPSVPRGEEWKAGVCQTLGVADVATMWGRVNGAVRSYKDLQTPLITAVEQLIDFVTEPAAEY